MLQVQEKMAFLGGVTNRNNADAGVTWHQRKISFSIYTREVLAAVQSASAEVQRGDEKRVGRTQALLFIKMLPICERANCGATVKIYCPSGKKCAARTIEK